MLTWLASSSISANQGQVTTVLTLGLLVATLQPGKVAMSWLQGLQPSRIVFHDTLYVLLMYNAYKVMGHEHRVFGWYSNVYGGNSNFSPLPTSMQKIVPQSCRQSIRSQVWSLRSRTQPPPCPRGRTAPPCTHTPHVKSVPLRHRSG